MHRIQKVVRDTNSLKSLFPHIFFNKSFSCYQIHYKNAIGITIHCEHVFLFTPIWCLICSQNGSRRPWYREDESENNNIRARMAYQALFKVTARIPESPEYAQFSSSVKSIAKNEFNFDYGHEEVRRQCTFRLLLW